MGTVELLNVTKMDICLADSSGNFGTIKPNSILVVDESVASKECVASQIRKGYLKIKQDGKFTGPKSGMKVKKGTPEKETGESTKPVNFFPPEQQDVPANVVVKQFPKAEEETTENLGKKIVKRGSKKKLVNVDVQKGGPRRSVDIPKGFAQRMPNVIDMDGNDGISGITVGAKVIIPSTIPGAAQLVDLEAMGWDNIVKLAKETDVLVDSLVKERKVSLYSDDSKSGRMKLVQASKDISFLRQLENGETDPGLLQAIAAKIAMLEGDDVQ